MAIKGKGLVSGIGINDADYVVQKFISYTDQEGKVKRRLFWFCPFYAKWSHMIKRCYGETNLIKRPTYQDCYVCGEWLTFSNFKAWMEKQDWEGKELDKDLLVQNNKIYSPETCVFLPTHINQLLISSSSRRGNQPIGVYKIKNRYKAGVYFKDKLHYLGRYATPQEAHNAWLIAKSKVLEDTNSEWEQQDSYNPIAGKALSDLSLLLKQHSADNLEYTGF